MLLILLQLIIFLCHFFFHMQSFIVYIFFSPPLRLITCEWDKECFIQRSCPLLISHSVDEKWIQCTSKNHCLIDRKRLLGIETCSHFVHNSCAKRFRSYRGADKSLARPGRKQARKHIRDARDFNNTDTPAVIKFFFPPTRAPKEIYAILTETLACVLPGRTKDLSAPLYTRKYLVRKVSVFCPISPNIVIFRHIFERCIKCRILWY